VSVFVLVRDQKRDMVIFASEVTACSQGLVEATNSTEVLPLT